MSDKDSVMEVMNVFDKFSLSILKPNKTKRDLAKIGAQKGVSLAMCSMNCINLTKKKNKNFKVYVFLITKSLKLKRTLLDVLSI